MFKAHIKLWVLKELKNKKASGYELMKRIRKISGKSPSPGYIYPMLINLEKKGLLINKKEGRKKIYTITKKGKDFLKTLKTNQEKTMKTIMKNYEPLNEVSKMKKFSSFFKSMQKDKDISIKDIDLWDDFRKILFKLHSNNYDKKRLEIRKIMKRTIKELKNL